MKERKEKIWKERKEGKGIEGRKEKNERKEGKKKGRERGKEGGR